VRSGDIDEDAAAADGGDNIGWGQPVGINDGGGGGQDAAVGSEVSESLSGQGIRVVRLAESGHVDHRAAPGAMRYAGNRILAGLGLFSASARCAESGHPGVAAVRVGDAPPDGSRESGT
jgi:hypothetical protein